MRLPCKRCGKTGHWKDDAICPRHPSRTGAGGTQTKTGYTTSWGEEAEAVCSVCLQSAHVAETGDNYWLILVDTAGARSVGGEVWAKGFIAYVKDKFGYDVEIAPDDEPFRFGPGPTIRSTYALLVPMEWEGKAAV